MHKTYRNNLGADTTDLLLHSDRRFARIRVINRILHTVERVVIHTGTLTYFI